MGHEHCNDVARVLQRWATISAIMDRTFAGRHDHVHEHSDKCARLQSNKVSTCRICFSHGAVGQEVSATLKAIKKIQDSETYEQ